MSGAMEYVNYIGHTIRKDLVSVPARHVQATQEFRIAVYRKELRSFFSIITSLSTTLQNTLPS